MEYRCSGDSHEARLIAIILDHATLAALSKSWDGKRHFLTGKAVVLGPSTIFMRLTMRRLRR